MFSILTWILVHFSSCSRSFLHLSRSWAFQRPCSPTSDLRSVLWLFVWTKSTARVFFPRKLLSRRLSEVSEKMVVLSVFVAVPWAHNSFWRWCQFCVFSFLLLPWFVNVRQTGATSSYAVGHGRTISNFDWHLFTNFCSCNALMIVNGL